MPGVSDSAQASDVTTQGERSPIVGERSRRYPDFFVVGHQKCGSTAIYMMLSGHPEVFMSDIKEPRYFASDLRSRLRPDGAPDKRRRPHTLDMYLSLYEDATPEQKIGDASPQYLRSTVAADAIAKVQPDARIIAILREPAGFLRSFHNEHVHNHIETQKDFRKALALEDARREGKRLPPNCRFPDALMYSEHVRYVEQLQRFHAHFPRERVLVLIYDDFRKDNFETMRKVLRFLDVDDTVPIEPVETKRLMPVRSRHLQRVTNRARHALGTAHRDPSRAGPLARAVDAIMPERLRSDSSRALLRRMLYTAPAQKPDEQLMLELRRRFKPEVVALSEYLDRDLVALWGYDEID